MLKKLAHPKVLIVSICVLVYNIYLYWQDSSYFVTLMIIGLIAGFSAFGFLKNYYQKPSEDKNKK